MKNVYCAVGKGGCRLFLRIVTMACETMNAGWCGNGRLYALLASV